MNLLTIETGKIQPMGLTQDGKAVNLVTAAKGSGPLYLCLYDGRTGKLVQKLEVPDSCRFGDVYGIRLTGQDLGSLDYNFEQEEVFTDPYAENVGGCEKWGIHAPRARLPRCTQMRHSEGWAGDRRPMIPLEDAVSYLVHVRGFTKHSSSGVRHKGTFEGLAEKLPYLADLGINQIEIMPAYEFNEVIPAPKGSGISPIATVTGASLPVCENQENGSKSAPVSGAEKATERVNYWGYTPDSLYFAPKAAYSAGDYPQASFERLVMACHDLGMELIMQFYFSQEYPAQRILEVLRFWVIRYHVDGIRILGNDACLDVIASDPYLADAKLFMDRIPEGDTDRSGAGKRHMILCQDDFMSVSRRYLKSDEDMLRPFSGAMLRNYGAYGVRNCIADYHGFTLQDLVSYDRKHNEDNGEENRDGTDYNFSWNCGTEGRSRKKAVTLLRRCQKYNALTFLFLAAGLPALRAGDEFGNSQNGNNNPYCQDNAISWIDWNDMKREKDQLAFVKGLIALRRRFPMLRPGKPFSMMDKSGCGYPDLSYHGTSAWMPAFENYNRHLGMMYAGEDQFLYAAYNMYWESNEFALPRLPKGWKWSILMQTDEGFYDAPVLCEDQDRISVRGRCICLLQGIKER